MHNYHPSTDLLVDYISGAMPLSQALCIATHVTHCHECQKHLNSLREIGSQLFGEQKGTVIKPAHLQGLKEQVLSKVALVEQTAEVEQDMPSQTKTPTAAPDKNGYIIPAPLRQFIPHSYDDLAWEGLSSSFKSVVLDKDSSGRQITLIRVKAGCHMPNHSHSGEEMTLVLEGSFSDENGRYHKGDFIYQDQQHTHKPIVSKDAECICLIALDSPIRLTSFWTRWLTPILHKYHSGLI